MIMKKIFLTFIMFVVVAICVSCNGHSMNRDNRNKVVTGSETMELIEKGQYHEIWRDTKTGQEYFMRINGVGGACGFELTGKESE